MNDDPSSLEAHSPGPAHHSSTAHSSITTLTWVALLGLLAVSYVVGTDSTNPASTAATRTLLWAAAFTKLTLVALVFMDLAYCRWFWRAAALALFLVCASLIAALLP